MIFAEHKDSINLNEKTMIIKLSCKVFFFSIAVLAITLVSCDPSKKLEKEENDKIQQFLASNSNLKFVKKPSGLYYLDVQLGPGQLPVKSDTAYIKYTGKLIDGTVFETNVGKTDTLIRPVDEGWLIAGFDEAITYIREGGKAMILIPSQLAYGPSGAYFIQGYTPLLFDIEIVKIRPGPRK